MKFPATTMGFFCCLALSGGATPAQSPSQATARVVGHAVCADTNAPARFATVTLQPLPARTAKGKYIQPDTLHPVPHVYSVTTDIDGAFIVEHVESGSYYVMAEFPGYLNQTWRFTEDELKHPTPELLDLIDRSVSKVQVEQGATAQVEIRLERGAAVSGRIRFDDASSSPAVEVPIQLLRQDQEGKQGAETPPVIRQTPFGSQTDDQGNFRIAGLPAGNVILKCSLRQVRLLMTPAGVLDALHIPINEWDTTPEQTLVIYSGGVFRQKDAKPIKLTPGAEVAGEDIVIPLDKICRVSGLVTSVEDGHPLNSGTVELLYADDGQKVSESKVGFDGSFHFALVSKGEYQLSVSGSDEVFLDRLGNSRSNGGQIYERSTQPLSVVDHDLRDVVIQLKPKSTDSP